MLTFLRRPLLHFEFPGDPGGAPPGAVVDPAGDPAPAEPAWTGPPQDEWQSVMGYIQQQQAEREAYEQQQYAAQQQAAQQEQRPRIDFFADDADQQLEGWFEQRLQQYLSPIQQFVQEQQMGEGEERALDILEDVVAREGDFIDNTRAFAAARALANVYFGEESQRHGHTPQAAQAALERAAADVREYEKAVASGAVERHMNQLKTLGNVPPEPGSTYAQGFQERTIPNYREGGSVSDRIFGSGAGG